MGLKLKIGKETIQGYTRELSGANMTDCYAYSLSALMAVEFLRLNKAKATGVEMGFCISALRQVLFAKIKRDPSRSDRLPLGTRNWGHRKEIAEALIDHPDMSVALGELSELLDIWGDHIELETNQ